MSDTKEVLRALDQLFAASDAAEISRLLEQIEALARSHREPAEHHLQAESINITTPPGGGL